MRVGFGWPVIAGATLMAVLLLLYPAPLSAQSGYGGPNILSRSAGYQGRSQGLAPLRLRGSLNGNFYSTSGLLGRGARGESILGTTDGVSAGGSLYGIQVSRRTQTTFSYSGAYNYTRGLSAFNGIDQALVVSHERQLTRRWGFFTGHSAGSQNSVLRARTVAPQSQFRSTFDESYVNYFEPLDAKLYYLNSNAGFFYQASQRLVFSMDGGLFTVRRRGQGLASSRGERAQGEISYRLGPKDNIAVLYNHTHFFFLNSFGESYTHNVQLSYGRRINRMWSMYLRGGPYRVESERLRSVAVDPFVAALIGQTVTVEAFYGIRNGVSAGGGVTAQGRRHGVTINYDRSVNPGNGLTLTALGQTASGYYNYSGLRKLSMGFGTFYSSLTPILQGVEGQNPFGSYGAGGGFAYRLHSSLFLTGNVEAARVQYDTTSFDVNRRTVTVGLAFSPGDLPLKWR